MDISDTKRISDLSYRILVVLALSYLVVLSVFPVNSNDIFFYLEIGRRFFSPEGVPTADLFRFTGANAALDCYHELGTMLVFYLAYVLGGFSAVILAKSALLLAMGVIPFWVAWKLNRQRHFFLLPVFAFFAFYGASIRFIERGSLFSDLFTTLVVGLIVLIKAKAGNVARYRATIPCVFLLWVNVHAGYVIGFMILLLWLLAELLNYLSSAEKDRSAAITEISSIVKISAGSVLLGLINPRGVYAYSFMAKVVSSAGLSIVRKGNPEFMSPFASGFVEFLDIRVFIVVLLTCLLLVVYSALRLISRKTYRDLPLFETLCICLFTYLGFSMVRFIVTASFGAVVIAAALLANDKLRFPRSGYLTRPWYPAFPALAMLGIAGCLFVVAAHGYGPPDATRRVGLGVSMEEKPVRACEFIDKINLSVNIFNKYEYGNYMIWRWQGKRKVYVHGFVGDVDFLQHDYAEIDRSAQDFHRIVQKYKIGAFLVQTRERFQNAAALPESYRRLMTDREWHLVYADDVALLFVKDMPENNDIIKRYSARTAGTRR